MAQTKQISHDGDAHKRVVGDTADDTVAAGETSGSGSASKVNSKAPATGKLPEAAAPAKRALGTKEVIPFQWKVVGTSADTVLILFKSTERDDAEAQLARLARDGYYTDLRIVENDMKIEQPKPVKAHRTSTKAAAKRRKAKTSRTPETKTPKTRRAVKKTSTRSRRSSSKKSGAKKTAGTAKKKKAASSKSAKKKTARRRRVASGSARRS